GDGRQAVRDPPEGEGRGQGLIGAARLAFWTRRWTAAVRAGIIRRPTQPTRGGPARANRPQGPTLHLHVPPVLHLGVVVRQHGGVPAERGQVQRTPDRGRVRGVRHRVDDLPVLRRPRRRPLLRLREDARLPRPRRRGGHVPP